MADRLQQLQWDAQMANLDPDQRAYLQAKFSGQERSVQPLPYWSTVRLNTVRAGAAPFTYTVDTTVRKAFAYATGAAMDVAGFAAGTPATFAETNLLKQSETLDNSTVIIWGLAAELCPGSDPILAAQIWRDCFVELSLNGTNSFRIGTLGMFPCAGGLYGQGNTLLRAPPTNQAGPSGTGVDGGPGPAVSWLVNGNPMGGNYYRFPQPYEWQGLGSGGKDTTLTISVTPGRAIVSTAPAARAAVPVVGAVTPGTIEPYTPPLAAAVFCDIRLRLVSISVSRRTINA